VSAALGLDETIKTGAEISHSHCSGVDNLYIVNQASIVGLSEFGFLVDPKLHDPLQ
jgi:hypothetical protein